MSIQDDIFNQSVRRQLVFMNRSNIVIMFFFLSFLISYVAGIQFTFKRDDIFLGRSGSDSL